MTCFLVFKRNPMLYDDDAAPDKESELFESKQQKKLIGIFGASFIANIKELHNILIQGHESDDDNKTWNLVNNLVTQLQKENLDRQAIAACHKNIRAEVASYTPSIKGKREDSEEGFMADFVEKDPNQDRNDYYNASRTKLLLIQISAAISLALSGCKIGAVVGATAGGGILSVPSAVVGGAVGAFTGGLIGLFAGSCAHTFFRRQQVIEITKHDNLVAIDKGLQTYLKKNP